MGAVMRICHSHSHNGAGHSEWRSSTCNAGHLVCTVVGERSSRCGHSEPLSAMTPSSSAPRGQPRAAPGTATVHIIHTMEPT